MPATVLCSRTAGVLCLMMLLAPGGAIGQPLPPASSSSAEAPGPGPDTSRAVPAPSPVPLAVDAGPSGQSMLIADGTATLLAVGATVIPVWAGAYLSSGSSRATAVPGEFLILSGLAFGPSAGQFYLGSYGPGLVGSAIRATGMVLVAKGILESVASAFCGSNAEDEPHPPSCSDKNGGGGTAAIGALIYVGGTLYSLIDIPFAGKRKQERESRYGFAPVLIPGPQGGISPGLATWARF